jgi:hypothetical protein
MKTDNWEPIGRLAERVVARLDQERREELVGPSPGAVVPLACGESPTTIETQTPRDFPECRGARAARQKTPFWRKEIHSGY